MIRLYHAAPVFGSGANLKFGDTVILLMKTLNRGLGSRRYKGRFKTQLGGFLQPGIGLGHRADVARQADLPENTQSRGKGSPPKKKPVRQPQVHRRLADFSPPATLR
jgi:hypothetical protein